MCPCFLAVLPRSFLWFSCCPPLLPKPGCLMIKAKGWKGSFSGRESAACTLPATVMEWPRRAMCTKLIGSITTGTLLHFFFFFWSVVRWIKRYLKLAEQLLLYWGIKSLYTQLHCPDAKSFQMWLRLKPLKFWGLWVKGPQWHGLKSHLIIPVSMTA